ncbi:MAG: flagellar protein FlgN [Bacillota bacterium]
MSENIEELYNILSEEYELYQKLNKTASEKNEAIVENEIDDLAEVVENEDEFLKKIEELEEKRTKIIVNLAEKYDLKDDFQYSNLINNFPEDWQDKFSEIRKKLLEVIDEIHEKNEENTMLLDEAIKLNNFSLNMLSKAVSPENGTYNKNQTSKKGKQNYNIIDRQA